jgi:D-galactarolactone cycloisomerase
MPYDTSFAIASVEAVHLAFKDSAGYWESYRASEGGAQTARFEFKPGWQTVYARYVETPLVKVTLTDGSTGWGEANCGIGPEVVCVLIENVIGPMAQAREFGHPVELWDFLYDAQRGRGYSSGYYLDALAALDIAVWDALGKREGAPVAALLSPAPRRRLPVYLSGVRRDTVKERVEHLNDWIGRGLRGAKIFLTGDIDAGLRELDALQAGAPGLEKWMVDTLWMCSFDDASRGKREFAKRGVAFFECPLQPEDLKGHQRLVALPGAPIALGEHFRTHYQLEPWLDAPRALDVYQPDIGRTGISDYVRQLEAATAAGIPVTPHMGTGVSVFQAATLQCAALASPNLLQEFQGGLSDKLGNASDSGWSYRDGDFVLPDRPGLGVALDEAGMDPHIVRR